MFTRLIDFLKRSPHEGDRKELPMPTDPAPSPSVSPPAPDPAPPTLSHLADALRELAQSQKALMDAVARVTAPVAPPASTPAPRVVSPSIAGDPGDGLRPSALVDFSRLSPLQQIAMGLRGAPVAPHTESFAPESELAHVGAD